MQILPSREHALRAMEARRNECLIQNRKDEAEQVQRDLSLIRRAPPGENLYQMATQSQERARKLESNWVAQDYRRGWPCGPLGLGLGLVGAGLGVAAGFALIPVLGPGAAAAVSFAGGFAGMSLAFLPDVLHFRAERARQTAQAIDRNYAYIQSYVPPEETTGRLPLSDFVKLAGDRETDLLAQGSPLRAANLAEVTRGLQSLGCESLEQAFDTVYRRAEDGPDKKQWAGVLERLQESEDVLRLVEAMASVGQLAQGAGPGSIEVGSETIRVGSVVLRRKKEPA